MNRIVQLAFIAALAVPNLARAEGWAVMSLNHCADVAAGEPARTLRESLLSRVHGEVMTEENTAKGLGGSASGSLEQAERLFGAARLDFTGGSIARAQRELQGAREQLVALPPSLDRWRDFRDVLTMQAWLQLRDGQKKEAEATLRQILVVEPEYVPSPQLFPPMIATAAQGVRAQLKKEKKFALQVRSAPGALPVYVGLKPLGHAPQKLELPAGNYRVEAEFTGARGMPRIVEVSGATEVTLATALEGSVWPDRGPCITTPASRAERLNLLTQIATTLNVQKLVGIEFDEPVRGERYLVADVLDSVSGQEIRAARVKLNPDVSQAAAISQLADFVATGKAPESVQVVASAPPAAAPAQAKSEAKPEAKPALAQADAPPAAAATPRPATAETSKEQGTSGMRIASYAAFGVAAAGAGLGVFELLQKSSANSDFDAAYPKAHAGDATAQKTAADALDRANTAGTLSTVGFVAAGAAAVTGVVLYVLSPSEPAVAPTAAVIDGKPGVAVAGRF